MNRSRLLRRYSACIFLVAGCGRAPDPDSMDAVGTTQEALVPTLNLFGNRTPSLTAANVPYAVELGVKFRSDVDGEVKGVRFYKGAGNTGTHVGHLWTRDGASLAQATFTAETATGWQQVTFSSPVRIKANTTYVASYHTNTGRFAVDEQFFSNGGWNSGPLHALKTGVDGANGVYVYGAGGFPNQSYNAQNYSVDVVFSPLAGQGTGLTARYFANTDLTGLQVTRVDRSVDFDWDSASPDPKLDPEHFSVRWTGKVLPLFSETYTFYTNTDDGVRLWVDGVNVVDDWTDHAETEDKGTVQLTGGKPVDIVMEFYENGGRALSTLSWSSPSQPKEKVPTTQLSPEANSTVEQPLDLRPGATYGARQVDVPALANWVNSGLYLKAGQSVTLTAFGSWVGDGNPAAGPTGPEGRNPSVTQRGCTVGSLTARLGLTYEDSTIFCVGSHATIVAPKEGILYLGAIVGTDLGDSYEARYQNSGTLSVLVGSAGSTVPSITMANVGTYDFTRVTSGWTELWSRHFIVTVPSTTAIADQATAVASLDYLDRGYDLHASLRGTTPFRGQRVRVVQDVVMEQNGWYMLAGNPIRTVRDAYTGAPGNGHLLRSSDSTYSVWGIFHELGHDFTQAQGPWWYQVGTIEGWPNIFTVHTLRALRRPNEEICGYDATCPTSAFCGKEAAYKASGTYDQLTGDPFLYLCFLLREEERYGATLYPSFFGRLNGLSAAQVGSDWGWVRDQFNSIVGTNTTPSFQEWHIPLP
jgi:hypothetical protein